MSPGWQRYLVRHPHVADALVAVWLFANGIPGSMLTTEGTVNRPPAWVGALVVGAGCIALLWRRRYPVQVAGVATASAMVMAGLGFFLSPLTQGPAMCGLYTVASRCERRTTVRVAASSIVLIVLSAVVLGPPHESYDLKVFGPTSWLLLATAVGAAVRLGRAYVAEARARAEYAERTREEEARHRVAEERMRIARELHDVVAHHLALANAQAGAVAHLLRRNPEQAERIVGDLTGTTRSALRELKATVGLLRQADDAAESLEPAPGLERLPELTSAFASAGLAVEVTSRGDARALAPGADLAAYRIVQEALTNVTKHAGTGAARVDLAYTATRLRITVSDDGVGERHGPDAAPGYGLIGMRERALSTGGSLSAGPRPGGGFEVVADLPLPLTPQPRGRAGDTKTEGAA